MSFRCIPKPVEEWLLKKKKKKFLFGRTILLFGRLGRVPSLTSPVCRSGPVHVYLRRYLPVVDGKTGRRTEKLTLEMSGSLSPVFGVGPRGDTTENDCNCHSSFCLFCDYGILV